MGCASDILSFVDKTINATKDFIVNVGTQVGTILEAQWKSIGAPIAEYVFGLLGFEDETVYSIQVTTQRLIQEEPANNLALAAIRAIQNDNISIADSLRDMFETGIVGTNRFYKDYGKNYYQHGLPTTNTLGRSIDEAELVLAIESDQGLSNVILTNYLLGYPVNEFWVKFWLQNNENYLEVPGSIIIEAVTWFYDGFTEDPILGTFTVNLREPDIDPVQFTTLGTAVPAPPFDVFYNVRYTDTSIPNTEIYWMYQRSLSIYPTLDGVVVTGTHQLDEMLPIVPLRQNFRSINVNYPVESWTGVQNSSAGDLLLPNEDGSHFHVGKGEYTLHSKNVLSVGTEIVVGLYLRLKGLSTQFVWFEKDNNTYLLNDYIYPPGSLISYPTRGLGTHWLEYGKRIVTVVEVGAPINDTVLVGHWFSEAYNMSTQYISLELSLVGHTYPIKSNLYYSDNGLIFCNYDESGSFIESILGTPWEITSVISQTTINMLGSSEVFVDWVDNGNQVYIALNSTDTTGRSIRLFNASTPFRITTTGCELGIGGINSVINWYLLPNPTTPIRGLYVSHESQTFCTVVEDTIFTGNKYTLRNMDFLPFTDSAYPTSKQILNILGINADDLIVEIEKNVDISFIEDAFIIFAMNIYTQTQHGLKVLFINFDKLFFDAKIDEAIYLANIGLAEPKINVVTIMEQSYNTAIIFNYIKRLDIVGVIGDVGTYNSTLNILPNTDYDEITSLGGAVNSNIVYRFQYSPTNYIELQVHGLVMMTNIRSTDGVIKTMLTQLDAVDTAKRANFIIPFPFLILDDLQYRNREFAIYESLHMVIYSTQTTYLKYYETNAFLSFVSIVLKFISILILVYSLGTASTISAALILIAEQLLIYYVLTIILKKLLKEAGNDKGKRAVVLATYAAVSVYFGGGFSGMSTAEALMLAVNAILIAVAVDLEVKNELLKQEISDFTEDANARQEALNNALDALDANKPPWDVAFLVLNNAYETPENFFERTIHAGNPGVLALDQIELYHQSALELPELDENYFINENLDN